MSQTRRVVVTGIGAITPLGKTFSATWQALLRKESGLTTLEEALAHQGAVVSEAERDLARKLPCQVAAACADVSYSRNTSRVVQLALQASEEAARQSQLGEWLLSTSNNIGDDDEPEVERRRHRVGVSIGCGMSSVREVVQAYQTIESHGFRKLSPHFVPKVLGNSPSGRVSIALAAKGPNLTAATACAASAHAIGEAWACIRNDRADIMICGGAEAALDAYSLAGFSRLRALSTGFNDQPTAASRPFDDQRDGFVMGEGAAILVLEEVEHARARLGRTDDDFIEIAGYGLSGDAFHTTAPDEQGRGAQRAMEMALADWRDGQMRIDYVNAHATSTPKGDEIESAVVDRVVQDLGQKSPCWLSSTKGATGHLLGAAGGLEAAITVQSLLESTVPPTLNLEHLGDCAGSSFLQHAQDGVPLVNMQTAMSNSFGFGGTNASLVMRKLAA